MFRSFFNSISNLLTNMLMNPILAWKALDVDPVDDIYRWYRRNINRPVLHFMQRRKRGWDDRDIWSLDVTFAEWVVPRLKRLKEAKRGVPVYFLPKPKNPDGYTYTDEEHKRGVAKYNKMLDEMIEGFELYAREQDCYGEDNKKINKALNHFAKHFFTLWT